MNTESDPLAEFRLPEDFLKARLPNGPRKETKDFEWIKNYRFPPSALNAIYAVSDNRTRLRPVLAVLMALFELWYTSGRWDRRYRNPVKLTSAYLKRFGVSRGQKLRALKLFEKAGIISVQYRGRGQNPWVTLKWEPLVS
jgi:hypothetical protein